MHTIFQSSYRTISIPPLPPPHFVIRVIGYILTRFPSHHRERHLTFIHGSILYLSLDGVIPEAIIYVYIPYNISCVSSVDRPGDKVY
jgi:hypothetical protein